MSEGSSVVAKSTAVRSEGVFVPGTAVCPRGAREAGTAVVAVPNRQAT